MIPHSLKDILSEHIDDLVSSGRAEGRSIDFKKDWSDQGALDSLAKDVCAFANAEGGDIVIGVTENDGVASMFVGAEGNGSERRIRQAEDGLRSRIEPKVGALNIVFVPKEGDPSVGAYIIRVGASVASPHRVVSNGAFYSRASVGNQIMDIFQVREAFLRGTLASEKLKEFRTSRIAQLPDTDAAGQTVQKAWVLLQAASVPSAYRAQLTDGKTLHDASFGMPMFDLASMGAPRTFNLDGVLVYASDDTHLQLFRDGKIEVRRRIAKFQTIASAPAPAVVSLEVIRDGVRRCVKDYPRVLTKLGHPPPYSMSLSLVNILRLGFTANEVDVRRPDRQIMAFPELVINDVEDSSIAFAIVQLTDMLYQAFGQDKTIG